MTPIRGGSLSCISIRSNQVNKRMIRILVRYTCSNNLMVRNKKVNNNTINMVSRWLRVNFKVLVMMIISSRSYSSHIMMNRAISNNIKKTLTAATTTYNSVRVYKAYHNKQSNSKQSNSNNNHNNNNNTSNHQTIISSHQRMY